jgi:hypothetical protein
MLSLAACASGGVTTTPVAANPGPSGSASPGATGTPNAHPTASASPTAGPTSTPTPGPTATPLYLYVATTQHIVLLPATASAVSTTAAVEVASANTSGVAVNSSFVATCTGTAINVYAKPLTATSTPAFHFSPVTSNNEGGTPFNYTQCTGDVAFDGSGNLYAIVTGSGYGTHGVVLRFATPLSAASSMTIVADLGISNNIVRGMLAFDPSNDLFLNSQLGLEEWFPPTYPQATWAYAFGSGNTGIGAAFDASGDAFFSNLSSVSFVPAPISQASTASYSLALGAAAEGVALSPAGLLVAIDGGGTMHVFAPPVSGGSSGVTSVPFTGAETANQLTFGY